jgi:hypothetical protein
MGQAQKAPLSFCLFMCDSNADQKPWQINRICQPEIFMYGTNQPLNVLSVHYSTECKIIEIIRKYVHTYIHLFTPKRNPFIWK